MLRLAFLFLLIPTTSWAQEAIALTTPIAKPSISNYHAIEFDIRTFPEATLRVVLADNTGDTATFEYPCHTGCAYDTTAKVATLITALNVANFSIARKGPGTGTLWQRLFDRLVLDFPTRFPGGAVVQ